MRIKIRSDSIEIDGYVNSIERNSKPLWSRIGKFIERICAGAFKKALKRADDVAILLNHDWNRQLGSTKQGNLELEEDAIGLHARAVITDPEVIEDARRGDLVGWSFGFTDREVENAMEDGLPLRKVRDLNLKEVSLLNRKMTPAYNGTLVTTRAVDGQEDIQFRSEPLIADEVEVTEESVEKSVENVRSEEDSTEENTDENKSQEQKGSNVEKSVEKNVKINYNVYRDIIKQMKEEE